MRKHTWASCFRCRSERSRVRSTRCTPDSRSRLQVQVTRRATNDKDTRHVLRTQVLRFRFTIKDIDRTSILHTGQPEPPCTHAVPMFRTGCAGSTFSVMIRHPASSHTGWPELPCANAVPMFRTSCRFNIHTRSDRTAGVRWPEMPCTCSDISYRLQAQHTHADRTADTIAHRTTGAARCTHCFMSSQVTGPIYPR